jgi:hypothetical protein
MQDAALDAQAIVQRLMEAYNRRDVEGYCACFAPDAVTRLYETDESLAVGMDAIRALYSRRFAENPALHITVQARIALDNVVVDRQRISGFDGGVTIEAIALFEIRAGLIGRASFIRRTEPMA